MQLSNAFQVQMWYLTGKGGISFFTSNVDLQKQLFSLHLSTCVSYSTTHWLLSVICKRIIRFSVSVLEECL